MLIYKNYQNKVLEAVDSFLAILKQYKKPPMAWLEYFERNNDIEKTGIEKNGGVYPSYKNYTKSPKTPFLCFKVPTGGGKTILAVETINKSFNGLIGKKEGLVVWLVPTEAIYSQTLEKLKNPSDPHRQVLMTNFEQINVFSREEALKNFKPQHCQNGNLSIILSIDKGFTNGEKVFDGNIDGFEQFNDLLEQNSDLLITNTSIENKDQPVGKNSLFNIIRLHNPIIIIDEGHLFKSHLIQSTIGDFNPSLIWEFTATPKTGLSNILHRTSPLELKEEEMIKLPIQIRHETTWQDVISSSIKLQQELEEKAKFEESITGRYIRPIVLIRPDQISQVEGKITVKEIKEYLAQNYPNLKTKDRAENGEKYQVAERYSGMTSKENVKSNSVNTLGKVKDLFSKESEIRFIIAYNAIREGWDCSFAYIYANLSNIKSQTDAEQFLGRILRMPEAKKTSMEELNKSYVITKAKTTDRTELESSINDIIGILTKSGFSKEEANKAIQKTEKNGENLNINQAEIPLITKKQQEIESILLPEFYFKDNNQEQLFQRRFLDKGLDLTKVNLASNLNLILATTQIVEIDLNEKEIWQTSYLDNELATGLFGLTLPDLADFILKNVKDKQTPKPVEYKIITDWLQKLLTDFSLGNSEQEKLLALKRQIITLIMYYKQIKKSFVNNYRKTSFENLKNENRLSVKNTFELKFENTQEVYYPSGDFGKAIYEQMEKLNDFEKNFVNKLNQNEKVKWIYRNREKKDFYIPGFWGKFYPDFIYQTTDEVLHIVETKGREDDTDKAKKELGELLQNLTQNQIIFEWEKQH